MAPEMGDAALRRNVGNVLGEQTIMHGLVGSLPPAIAHGLQGKNEIEPEIARENVGLEAAVRGLDDTGRRPDGAPARAAGPEAMGIVGSRTQRAADIDGSIRSNGNGIGPGAAIGA